MLAAIEDEERVVALDVLGQLLVALDVELFVDRLDGARAARRRRARCASCSVRASWPPQPTSQSAATSARARCAERSGRGDHGRSTCQWTIFVMYALCCHRMALGLDVDDLHEEEVLHAAHVVGALVDAGDLAGDEVLRAELLAVLRDVRGVEDRVLLRLRPRAIIWFCRSRAIDRARCWTRRATSRPRSGSR